MRRSIQILTAVLVTAAVFGLTGCASGSDPTPTVYTVTFNASGGSPAPGPQSITEGAKAAAPSPVPVKPGQILEGWYTEAAYTNRWDFNADTVTRDMTLYAKWAPGATGEQNKEALQNAGEITLTARDGDGADVELVVEVGDDTITIVVDGGETLEYPSEITDSAIILKGAGSGGADVSLGYVINEDKTLTITGGLDRIEGSNLTGDPVVSEPNNNLTRPEAPGSFVAVTNITGVPTGGTAGTEVDLSGATVVPADATNRAIVWSVKSAGTTGVSAAGMVNNKFTPAAAGTLTLTATIANGTAQGTAFAKDFEIIISPANSFVPATNITGVPAEGTAGIQVDLSAAAVVPDNANNKAIVWSVKDAGGTGVSATDIVNDKFTPANPGTLTLTATIANGTAQGTAFIKDFAIVISPAFVAVTDITGVPTGGTAGTQVDLNVAAVEPSDATNKAIVWTVKLADTTGVSNAGIVDGKFTPASAGTLTLTATIANGTAQGAAFAKDFEIIISPADTFVPVTNITGAPNSGTVGTPVDLSVAAVIPDNADHKTIVWTVKADGGTGLATADIVAGKFTAAAPGTVKLTATIADGEAEGTDYTRDFDILITVPGSFVPVTNITGVPGTGLVGSPVSLGGATVVPTTASYKTISWAVKTPGAGVTAITGTSFTPTAAGTVVLTARILSGAAAMAPYTQDFTITITTFVAVTDIDGLEEARNVVTGSELDLNAGLTVTPATATYKDIVWSVTSAGETGLTSAAVQTGVFTPEAGGTVTLTATILNGRAQGSNYTQSITLTIVKPVMGIGNIPTTGNRGHELDISGASVTPSDATYKTIVWTIKSEGGTGVTTLPSSGKFTPPNKGTLVLTATITNGSGVGTNFVRDHTITVHDPAETEISFGFEDHESILLRGNANGSQSQLSREGEIQITRGSTYYVSLIGTYSDVKWYLNGTPQTVSGGLIYLPTDTARTIVLSVEGKNGDMEFETSGTYRFVVK
jgi:uncharacterized repeat protein (TIGR02543 family)